MKNFPYIFTTGLILLFSMSFTQAQQAPDRISTGVFLGETPPLRDIPQLTPEELAEIAAKAEAKAKKPRKHVRLYENLENAYQGLDPLLNQSTRAPMTSATVYQNFEGQASSSYPPDCNGTVGPDHFMQTINVVYAIYSKSGTLQAGPTALNTLFNGVAGSTRNDGDPIVLYDEQADRWLVAEFSIPSAYGGGNDYVMVAVSTTNDPTGTWYAYSFDVDDLPDYEKLGVWRDGYYMATNTSPGNDVYVLERDVMLAGGPSPQMVAFDNDWRPNSGFHCIMPLDNDGTFASDGTPGQFITINDDSWSAGTSDQLWLYELDVDWTTPGNSTFDRVQQINVASFDSNFGSNWNDIIQPGTSQRLDAVPQVIMNIPQYRNFGTYETIVACHTVDVDNTPRGGIRWYELRKNNGETGWSIRQQGTYAPSDGNSRWMGSIMLNGNNQIALGFSITGNVYPGIRITGQTAAEYNAASGAMNVTEETIQDGVTYQSTYNRWGDYALMQVDPDDDNTFWFTTQYTGSSGSRKTKITSFAFGTPPVLSSVGHSNVGATSVTLSGDVNPSGLSTTYYFEYTNTATSVTLTTASQPAGSGSSNVPVSENLTGLTTGVTYNYRLIATNSDGTANSTLDSFTTGMPDLSTTDVSGITSSSATSGGSISGDGGFSVTSRGVCWSTAQNPTLADSKTSDGIGTGSFSSSITGLSANTTYYVRAYATNSTGTSYGDEESFTTLCGDYSLPFSENFNASTNLPDCWVIIDNQGGGLVWEFDTHWSGLSGSTGNYANAYGGGPNSMNTDLISPLFDFSDFNNVTLSFSHYFRQLVNSSATLSYSIDNGSTWTQIQQWNSTITNPTSYSQHISAADGEQSVRFKWNYTASIGYYWDIDNISITADFTGASWAGTTSTDWFTTGNWSGSELPESGDNVLIPFSGVSNFPVISGNHAEIDDLTVYSGASVSIAPSGQLTVNGTLKNYSGNSGIVIESDATGTGSLIHSTASISGTIERYVTGGWGSNDAGWHMIGAPVASQAISVFTTEGSGNGYDFYGWDEATNYWMNYKDDDFVAFNGGSAFNPGQGYLISYEQTQDGKAFTGIMNVSGISLSGLSYDVSGWHLISNPFTSALKWNDGNWALTNVAGIAKIWSESGKSYVDINANGIIPMAQGFMIQVNSAGNSLTIPSASRTHNTQEWYKSGNENSKIRLVAAESDFTSFQESIIQLDPQSTAGFDFQYDSRFLPGYAPQFYGVAGEELLSTSTFPAMSAITELPFGFVKNNASEYFIRLEENFDACKVLLIDLKTGSIQELSQDSRYDFTSEEGDIATRFLLRINPVGVDELTFDGIHSWVYENRLYIQNPGGTTKLAITDLAGRRIYEAGLSGEGLHVHDLNLNPGLYLINLRNGEENVTIKAFMK